MLISKKNITNRSILLSVVLVALIAILVGCSGEKSGPAVPVEETNATSDSAVEEVDMVIDLDEEDKEEVSEDEVASSESENEADDSEEAVEDETPVLLDPNGNAVDLSQPVTLTAGEDAFVLYISGIDVWGSVTTQSRSDVNILAVVNTKTGKILLINTPRDYYVPIPVSAGACDKLTHAGLYGIDCSMGALESLYGVNIDYYLRMNFSGFEAIINAMGGIDVYSEYTFTVDPIKTYNAGMNHLTGLEALAFARERHAFADGDNQRGKNQMEIIKAMVAKVTTPEFLYSYNDTLNQISGMYQTDISNSTIYDLVRYQLTSGTSWQIDTYSVSGSGSYKPTYSVPSQNLYVMMPNQAQIETAKAMIATVLSE